MFKFDFFRVYSNVNYTIFSIRIIITLCWFEKEKSFPRNTTSNETKKKKRILGENLQRVE